MDPLYLRRLRPTAKAPGGWGSPKMWRGGAGGDELGGELSERVKWGRNQRGAEVGRIKVGEIEWKTPVGCE